MKQLLILSGKGGTGKTTVASAFIELSKAKVFADCDVDAPNLHLIINRETAPKKTDFFGLDKAVIDNDICVQCDACIQNCRFDAIKKENGYHVDHFACEGCGVCEATCPVHAVKMIPAVAGELELFDSDILFSTAKLKMGSGNSGKLVTEVKNQIKSKNVDSEVAIIDGSPGIGCPVIASLSGVDMVLIVAEPSASGISDMERIIETAKHFNTKAVVCVNKFNVNLANTEKIERFCKENGLEFVGKIPFDPDAVKAVNSGKSIAQINCKAGAAVREVYSKTMKQLLP